MIGSAEQRDITAAKPRATQLTTSADGYISHRSTGTGSNPLRFVGSLKESRKLTRAIGGAVVCLLPGHLVTRSPRPPRRPALRR